MTDTHAGTNTGADDAVTWDAIERFLSGTSAPAEAMSVQRFLDQHPDARTLVHTFQSAVQQLGAEPTTDEIDALHASVQRRIASPAHRTNRKSLRRRHATGLSRESSRHETLRRVGVTAAIAFSIVFAAIAALAGTWRLRSPSKTPRASHEYATTAGQCATLQLSDGTKITLAPQSRLSVPADFGIDRRTLSLRGEAYFQVVAHASAPFVVQTNTVETRALGTAFDVRAYTTSPTIRVTVVDGKVSTGSTRHAVTLTAGDVANVTDSTVARVLTNDPPTPPDWTRGKFTFDNALVSDVLSTLGNWYGYAFRPTDTTLLQERVTASFPTAITTQTLTALRALLDVDMTVTGDTVVLSPRRGRVPDPTAYRNKLSITTHHVEVGK